MVDLIIAKINVNIFSIFSFLIILLFRFLTKNFSKKYVLSLWIIFFISLIIPLYIPISIENSLINLPIVQYDFNSIIVNISSFKGEYSALNTIDFYYAGIIGILIELCRKEYSFRKNIKCSFKSGDIFLSDYTDTPILFLNKIIIPSRLANTNLKMIIDHENVHKDNKHIFIMMLALLSCLLNWYNILAWVSFKLFSNDLEMRTDEIVIDKYNYTKKEYCEKLLEYISIKKKKMTINELVKRK